MRLTALVLLLAAAISASGAAAAPAPPPVPPPIKHVFVIVLENEDSETTFGAGSPAPYLASTLPSMGEFAYNYYGTGHHSNDNYLSMISGQAPNPETQGDCKTYSDFLPGTVNGDGQAVGTGCVYPAAVQTIANQLMAAGLTWKGYMEDMGNDPARESATCGHPVIGTPDGTQLATTADQYASRHNPFVYFHSIIDTPACASFDVNLNQLTADLKSAATTPNYAFITPDLCNDGHDSPCPDGNPGGLAQANSFLAAWVPKIVSSPAFRSGLLIVTFDESEDDGSSCCGEQPGPNTPNAGDDITGPDGNPGTGGGQVGAVLVSPWISPGTVTMTPYNHYSQLASVEAIFGLPPLGYAATPGLVTFGSDVYTRTPPAPPAPKPPKPHKPRKPHGHRPHRH